MELVDFVVRRDGLVREEFADCRRESERRTAASVEERTRPDERA